MYQLGQQQLNYRSYTNRVKAMYRKPVAQTSTALILTLITIAFFGFAAIRPTLSTVSELVSELETKRDLDKQISKKLLILQDLQDKYILNQNRLVVFNQAIPSEHDLNQYLLQLEYLAFINQTTFSSIRVDPLIVHGSEDLSSQESSHSEINTTHPELKLSVSVDSEQQSIQNFLNDISRLKRISYIDSIDINRSQNEATSSLLTATFEIYIFWTQEAPQDFALEANRTL